MKASLGKLLGSALSTQHSALSRIALVAALATAGVARAAEPPITVETVRIGFGGQDQYEVGSWTPLWVDLKAGPGRFRGELEVVVADDDGTPTSSRRTVEVAAGETATFATYTRPGQYNAEFTINVYEEGARRPRASKPVSPTGGALAPGQTLLLTMGRVAGIEEVPAAAGLEGDANSPYARGPRVVVSPVRVPAGIPGRWYGYEAAEVVVLNTNDTSALEALNAGRGEALKEWVRNGGHLVLAIGEKWQQLPDSALAGLMPAVPRGRLQISDLGALESFAGAKAPISAGDKKVTVTQLEPVEARGGRALDNSLPAPLVVRGHYGFGRVTVVGLDVDQKPFADWADRKDFWVKVLDLRRRADDPNAAAAKGMYQAGPQDVSDSLHSKLDQFPGVRLVPFAYVAFFVFVYILLIGPGDYFFLKKVVKRMELTWVTFPLIVATVSILAYVAAYAVKGTDLKINKVDAVDVDQSGRLAQARGTTWFTVFSPKNRDYDVSIAPLPLDRDPQADAAEAPRASGTEVVLSYFGAADRPYGMGGPGGMALSTSTYAYGPRSEPEALAGVRVPIWTTKAFAGRWSGPAQQIVDAELQQAGPDRLAGTVANRLRHRTLRGPIPGRGVMLIYGKQFYDLGELKPGQVRPIGEINPLVLSAEVDRIRDKLPGTNPFQQADPRLNDVSRGELVFESMFAESAGAGKVPAANHPLRYLDLSGQLELDRPMLVAEVDGPAAALDLGQLSAPPKTEATTILRVILPPPAPEADAEETRPAGKR